MSAKLRVLPLRPFFAQDLAYLRERLAPSVELVTPAAFTPQALAEEAARGVDVLLGGVAVPEVLSAAKGLKLFQVPWTGVDTLDFALLRRTGVPVCNSHSSAAPVAEYALALLLSLLKAIPLHDARLRKGEWLRPSKDGQGEFHPPRTLAGSTVGFLGYGAIARELARLLDAFKVRLVAVAARERVPAPEPLAWLKDPEELDALLAESDALVVAAPLTPKTRGILDARALARLRPEAVLVNVARAELIDEAALYAALKEGRLAGAALDAWSRLPSAQDPAPLPSKLPFHELDNVVLSPHRAGFAKDRMPHLADAVENINRLAAGRPLINRVDLDAGY